MRPGRLLVEALRKRGLQGTVREAQAATHERLLGALHRHTGSADVGTPVYERDWDVLVVLDACRHDLLADVTDAYDFLPDRVPRHVSNASYSRGWMRANFRDEYADTMAATGHISANPYTADALDQRDWAFLTEVWRTHWDADAGTVPPRPVTDHAIRAWRRDAPDRLVVHYMQPHAPFIAAADDHELPNPETGTFGVGIDDRTAFERLRDGDLDRETLWSDYRDTLRLVLDDVAILRNNIEADTVVITSDHGNAIGEAGVYGHPPDVTIPAIREVPWVELSTTDTESYTPEIAAREPEADPEDRLRDLGYR